MYDRGADRAPHSLEDVTIDVVATGAIINFDLKILAIIDPSPSNFSQAFFV